MIQIHICKPFISVFHILSWIYFADSQKIKSKSIILRKQNLAQKLDSKLLAVVKKLISVSTTVIYFQLDILTLVTKCVLLKKMLNILPYAITLRIHYEVEYSSRVIFNYKILHFTTIQILSFSFRTVCLIWNLTNVTCFKME